VKQEKAVLVRLRLTMDDARVQMEKAKKPQVHQYLLKLHK